MGLQDQVQSWWLWERYKFQLVAKGYNQQEDLDFTKTFTLVAKLVILCVLLASCSHNHSQMEPSTTNFFNGDLDEDVYMHLPVGFRRKGETRVCKLNNFYMISNIQASQQWFANFLQLFQMHDTSNQKHITHCSFDPKDMNLPPSSTQMTI